MKRFFTLLLLVGSLGGYAQVNGDFRSKQSGDWHSAATWEVFNQVTLFWDPATGVPTSTNSVWIQDGDSVYMNANGSCKDLHLNAQIDAADSARIYIGGYTLNVYGKIRTYSGAKGTMPGSPSTGVNNSQRFLVTTGSGSLTFAGTSRAGTLTGEWGVPFNFIHWTLKVNTATETDTITIKTNIRSSHILVSKGILLMDAGVGGALRPDSGVAGTGKLTIQAQGTLIMNQTPIARVAAERFGYLLLEEGGRILLPTGTVSNSAASSSVSLLGTVISANGQLIGNGGISGATVIDTYTNLRLEANLSLPRNITVNGNLTLTATNQLSLNSNTLTYGPNALVEYAGTTAQTTSDIEYPASNGPSGFIVNNSAGLTLHGSRTVSNTVKMIQGALTLGATTLNYGSSASLEYAGTALQTTSNNEFPKTSGPAHLIINNAFNVQLSDTHQLSGNLTFTNGKLVTTNAGYLILSSTSVVNGADNTKFINGPVEVTVASASQTTKTIPIGKGTTYRPLSLTVTQSVATATSYRAELFISSAPNRSIPSTIDSISSLRYWTISKGIGASVSAARIQLSYGNNGVDYAADSSKLRIVKDNGAGSWIDLGGIGSANNSGTILSDTNFTSFGDFALAYAKVSSLYPYPIISIDSLQFVSAQKLALGNTRPDYQNPVAKNSIYGDTVQVEGVVTFDPRYYGLSINRKATFIQNPTGGPWSGIEVMCDPATVSGWSGGLATYKAATQFYQSSVKGLKVRYVGVLKNFNGTGGPITTGETQLNILPYPAEIINLNPVPITPTVVAIDQLMKNNGSGTMVVQPITGEQYEGVYVELKNVTVVDRTGTGTPSGTRWTWSLQDANGNKISVYDFSAYFRNDNLEDTVGPPAIPGTPYFTPPQIGVTLAYVRGVITESYITATGNQQYVISPLMLSDLGPILGVAPTINRLPRNPVIATSANPVVISARIIDDTSVVSASLFYAVGNGGFNAVIMSRTSGSMTDGIWQASIPAQTNGSIVKYYIRATDNSNASSNSPDSLATNNAYIVTDAGVTTIQQLQYSPFTNGNSIWAGDTLTGISVKGIVTSTTKSDDLGLVTIQNGNGPNSAIFVQPAVGDGIDQWNRGDSIVITSCVVRENFNVTTLYNAGNSNHTVAATSKTLPAFITNLSLDSVRLKVGAYTEPYEAMLVEFDSVYAVNLNADAPSNFGEWAFRKDTLSTNGLRVDDQSNDIPANFNTDSLTLNKKYAYVRGILTFSFSNWKLLPRNRDDIAGFKTNYGTTSIYNVLADVAITIYPNPALNELTIRLTNPNFRRNTFDFSIALFDLTGRIVKEVNLAGVANTINQVIPVSDINPGIYFCRISSGDSSKTVKVVIAR
jgi:hypothetical protein